MMELKTLEDVFGYRLRELRGNLTQKQIADILETDPQTVQRWESGKLIPQAATRAYIAEKLKVAETFLFLDPDHGPDASRIKRLRLLNIIHLIDDEAEIADLLSEAEDIVGLGPNDELPMLPKDPKKPRQATP
jgi:transcriptional regulator with XRE-family HTH domain